MTHNPLAILRERGTSDVFDYVNSLLQSSSGEALQMAIFVASTTESQSLCCEGIWLQGEMKPGDVIRVTQTGATGRLESVVSGSADEGVTDRLGALHFHSPLSWEKGSVITPEQQPLDTTDQFEAILVWLQDETGIPGRRYGLHLAGQSHVASLTNIKYGVDLKSGVHEAAKQLLNNQVAVCQLSTLAPVAFSTFQQSLALGVFCLSDPHTHSAVGVGLIRHSLRRAQNVHQQALSITRTERERLNQHRGRVIWFTGLSGSGKSTLANALEIELHKRGLRTYILDGDNVRQGLNKDLGFTEADRVENIRRIAEVAKLMLDAGLVVMTAFISPFRQDREMARDLIGEENFIEVHVNTPLEVCEQRDVKGLYKKAREGKIPNMTGINSPYEAPIHPNYTTDSQQTIQKIISDLTHLVV